MTRLAWDDPTVQQWIQQGRIDAPEAHEDGRERILLPREGYPNEKAMQDKLGAIAKQYGRLFYHTWNSKRSDPGFPDCVVVLPEHPQLVLFWELKMPGKRPTQRQWQWLEGLQQVNRMCDIIQCSVIYPQHMPLALRVLRDPTWVHCCELHEACGLSG